MGDEHENLPHVVVLGGGFGGLQFCKHLKGHCRITLIDRTNHHLFQPLLYQVAMAGLSAPEVAEPIRSIFRHDRRITVLMDTAERIDLERRRVVLSTRDIAYDYLVIALGGGVHYFGNDHWEQHAPGLKTLADALRMRRMILTSFEKAENCDDPDERRRLMNIVVVGGGPTGVELAGAMAELTRQVFKRDFRRINPAEAKVILVEGGDHLLDTYPVDLSLKAAEQLESLGVVVMFNHRVVEVTDACVTLDDGETIPTRNVLWGAGVHANPITRTLGIELGPGGRIPVEPDLSLPGRPDVFAIGDIVTLRDPNRVLVPGVAPAAMQMGRHVAALIDEDLGQRLGAVRARKPFVYVDKGSMATIGRKRGVAWVGGLKFSGLLAWLTWLGVHLIFLIGYRNKLAVLLSWFYSYVAFKRGARIIFNAARSAAADSSTPPQTSAPGAPVASGGSAATIETDG